MVDIDDRDDSRQVGAKKGKKDKLCDFLPSEYSNELIKRSRNYAGTTLSKYKTVYV